MKNNDSPQIIQHLANEQTFLAWLRTSVEIMAFGFVSIKFSLFACQVIGILLVAIGPIMILLAYLRYLKTVRQLREGHLHYSTLLLTVTAFAILAISSVMLYCLLSAEDNLQRSKVPEKTVKVI